MPPLAQQISNLPSKPSTGISGYNSIEELLAANPGMEIRALQAQAAQQAQPRQPEPNALQQAVGIAKPVAGIASAVSSLGAAPTGLAGLIPAGAALPALGLGAGALVGAQQLSGVKNLFDPDEKVSFLEQAALMPLTGGLSFLANPIKDLFGTGEKGKERLRREAAIDFLAERTGLGEDVGIDTFGGQRNSIGERLDKVGPQARYNVNFDDPLAAEAVSLVNPLAHALFGEDKKLATDMAGTFANQIRGQNLAGNPFVAETPDQVFQNALSLAGSLGLTPEDVRQSANELFEAGELNEQEHTVFLNSIKKLETGNPQAGGT